MYGDVDAMDMGIVAVALPALVLVIVPVAVPLAVELSVVETGGAIENSELSP